MKFKSFIAGAVSIVAIVAVLMGVGVLPLEEETTTVVKQTGATQTATTPVALKTTGALSAQEIYEKYSGSVVEVLSAFSAQTQDPFGQQSSGQALGSGFVVSTDGKILTNAHVIVENGVQADKVSVVFKSADGEDTTEVPATVVGVDETSDVALLKIDPAKVTDLQPVVLGDSSAVQPGQEVVAIGNPLGYDFSVTSGIVSAVHRNLQSPNGAVIPNGIQTDAAINSGNSGGPLFDAAGQVIGINEQIATQSGGNEGLGFAVPINTAKRVMQQLESSGKVTYAYLGVQGQTVSADIAAALGLDVNEGVLVAEVAQDSPAAKAGLKGGTQQTVVQNQWYILGGDVIQAIDGEKVDSAEELSAAIMEHEPGDEITLTVHRDGGTKQLQVTLAERPNS